MRLLLLVVALLLPTSTLAAGWESGMVEDEGGPSMQAWVSSEGTGDFPPELRMMCFDQVNLRYGMGSGIPEGVEMPTDPLDFVLDFGTEKVKLSMQFEEMDGAFAAYFSKTDPTLALLKSSPSVTVSDPTGLYHNETFSLSGSSKAIAALLASCR